MFSALRTSPASRTFCRAFSTTPSRSRWGDLSRLTLIGNLARDPESRLTKNEKEYMVYTIVTNGARPPPDANGERAPPPATYHKVISFQETSNKYIRTLKKGSKVFVEAGFELREPEAGSDPNSPHGQRQIFLRHETIRVLSSPKSSSSPSPEASEPAPAPEASQPDPLGF